MASNLAAVLKVIFIAAIHLSPQQLVPHLNIVKSLILVLSSFSPSISDPSSSRFARTYSSGCRLDIRLLHLSPFLKNSQQTIHLLIFYCCLCIRTHYILITVLNCVHLDPFLANPSISFNFSSTSNTSPEFQHVLSKPATRPPQSSVLVKLPCNIPVLEVTGSPVRLYDLLQAIHQYLLKPIKYFEQANAAEALWRTNSDNSRLITTRLNPDTMLPLSTVHHCTILDTLLPNTIFGGLVPCSYDSASNIVWLLVLRSSD